MITRSLNELFEKPMSGEWGSEASVSDIDAVGVIRTTNFSQDIRFKTDSDIVRRNIDDKKAKRKRLKHGDIIIEKSGGSPTQPNVINLTNRFITRIISFSLYFMFPWVLTPGANGFDKV